MCSRFLPLGLRILRLASLSQSLTLSPALTQASQAECDLELALKLEIIAAFEASSNAAASDERLLEPGCDGGLEELQPILSYESPIQSQYQAAPMGLYSRCVCHYLLLLMS